MEKSSVKIQKHTDLSKNFSFSFKIGALKEKTRFTAINQKIEYKGGPARTKSSKQANITNNDVMNYLYKRDIKVLNIPFLVKDKNMGKVADYFVAIGTGMNKQFAIKEAGKALVTIVQDFMTKGKFGKNKKGFRTSIDTGQLAEAIIYKFENSIK